MIIDAKCKPLNDRCGVDREDLYQLNSYLTAHKAELGALAYPTLDQQPPPDIQQRNPWLTQQNRAMNFVQLPTTESDCTTALSTLITSRRMDTLD
ncbi:hypothetical protein ACFQ05_26695 [Amycolatopsis umgeniensis]|uniref:5-methylcytosine-specific restriction endonuclease McrBC regulatory subunit McrC n=1 Tax=Amycolatopsis umgeniensis TaxID=336628 RepID=A0A841B8W1_9PSEU|nr:5-methylcytosine-specific restriction endonuclease McrBC regulatory subunit McrC [Amycolatopsis umgeniensis]